MILTYDATASEISGLSSDKEVEERGVILLLLTRSLADFNCPQAAKISRPRGVRTGEE